MALYRGEIHTIKYSTTILNSINPKISKLPYNYFNSFENRQIYMKNLEYELNIKTMEDWYDIPSSKVGSIYKNYSSMYNLLKHLYPNYEWIPWKFSKIPTGFLNSQENQKIYFKHLEKELKIEKMEDWYKITTSTFKKYGGLYKRYNSITKMLKTIYPEYDWKPWKFSCVPHGYWNLLANQRFFFEFLEKELNIKKMEDWYNINSKQICKYSGIYQQYNSMSNLLKTIFPDYNWLPWKFSQVPKHYWSSLKNQRYFLNYLTVKINQNNVKNLYNLNLETIQKYGGLHDYYSSNFQILVTLLPDYQWIPWKFEKLPNRYWDSKTNCSYFISEMEKNLKINKKEDWYNIQSTEVILYSKFNSMIKMLQTVYPNYIWVPWKFIQTKNGCWDGEEGIYNKRFLFNDISEKLKVKNFQDWYLIKYTDITKSRGASILHKYKSNLNYCFTDLYPEVLWLPWRFKKVPANFWDLDQNCHQFLKWCENYFNIKSKQEWHFASVKQIRDVGGGNLIRKYKSLKKVIHHFYSNCNQDQVEPKTFSKKTQFRMFKLIEELFPTEEVFFEYKHPAVVFKDTLKKVEFDVFIPSLNLAFEYRANFDNTIPYFGYPEMKKDSYREKQDICKDNSITLIEVPYFDEKKTSLIPLINSVRSDLLK